MCPDNHAVASCAGAVIGKGIVQIATFHFYIATLEQEKVRPHAFVAAHARYATIDGVSKGNIVAAAAARSIRGALDMQTFDRYVFDGCNRAYSDVMRSIIIGAQGIA